MSRLDRLRIQATTPAYGGTYKFRPNKRVPHTRLGEGAGVLTVDSHSKLLVWVNFLINKKNRMAIQDPVPLDFSGDFP